MIQLYRLGAMVVTLGLLSVSGTGVAANSELSDVSGRRMFPAPTHPWASIFRGVHYMSTETSAPVPMKIHAFRVDLMGPSIRFLVTTVERLFVFEDVWNFEVIPGGWYREGEHPLERLDRGESPESVFPPEENE